MPWFAHAYRFERELHDAYAALGCEPPTYEPRATGHIPEMIELIEVLIERGHAYPADDGSGDVYFDVASWPAYGVAVRAADRRHGAGRGRRPARQARPARLRAVEGPQGRPSRRPRPGRRRGAAAGRAGTWSARRWPASTSATSSTSTAAGSTCASRTTRTSSPSRPRPGQRVRPVLDAQRLGHRGRGEDEQVARQRRPGLGGDQALPAPGRAASTWPQPHYRSAIEFSDDSLAEAAAALARIDSFVGPGRRSWSATPPDRVPDEFVDRDGRRPRHAGRGRRAARGGPGRQRRARRRRPR